MAYCYQDQGNMPHGECLKVKPVGKPDAVAPHVRFDERGWETGLYATAPVLDSTGRQMFAKFRISTEYLYKIRHPQKYKYCKLIRILKSYTDTGSIITSKLDTI